ncbi:MAG: transglycosylase SLT domain-containing protein [Spirochaetes bacterium]|nr:transglycosylase SLT domain-containing protein [Spirochaetota bacterium]
MNGYLILLPSNKKILLNNQVTKIGRNQENDIIIKNSFVSKFHCEIIFDDNNYIIKDLSSKNGTFVNGEKISGDAILKDHDVLTFNSTKPMFKFFKGESSSGFVNAGESFYSKPLKKLNDYVAFRMKYIILISIFVFILAGLGLYIFRDKNGNDKYSFKIKEDIVYKKYSELMEKFGEKYLSNPDIISKIRKYIIHYKSDNTYKISMENREKYIDMIEDIFKAYKVPLELSYLALIESNYNPKAYNRFSGARGLWQFMPETAIQYGLIVNRKIDERTDPVKSTQAAAAYLHNLISIFGVHSFTLTIAAFNVGDGTIMYSLKKIDDPVKDRNFWYLYKNDLIPDETKEYVLKALAVIIMSENRDVFN